MALQQPMAAEPGILTLDILKDSFHRLVIVDAANQNPYYRIHNSASTRSVQAYRPSPDHKQGDMLIGHADFHTFSSDVDLQVGDVHGIMERKGVFSRSSLVRGGPFAWEWRSEAIGRGLTLVDEKGLTLAEFEGASSFSFSKVGKLMVRMPMGQGAMDWVVVTGLARVELMRKRRRRAVASAGGGVAAC
jgi:hypothetical protein